MKYLLFLILFVSFSFSSCTKIERIDNLKQASLEEIQKIEKDTTTYKILVDKYSIDVFTLDNVKVYSISVIEIVSDAVLIAMGIALIILNIFTILKKFSQ